MTRSLGLSLANSYRVPYFVDSVLAVAAIALVAWKVRDVEAVEAEAAVPEEGKGGMAFTASMKAMMFFAFTYGGAIGLTMPLTALLYSDKFGVEPLTIGAIISATGLIGLAASWLAGRVSDSLGRKPVLALGEGVGRLMGFILPLMPTVNLTAFCHLLRKTGFSVSRPATDALKADVAPPGHRAEFFGYYQTAYRVGDIIFPVVGTYLYASLFTSSFTLGGVTIPGYAVPYLLSSFLGLAGLLVALVFVGSQKNA